MKYIFLAVCLLFNVCVGWATKPQFSTAGFYELDYSGRKVYNMNPAWRFLKADAADAWKVDYDDSEWEMVSLPHGLEYLPMEASGCVNYQGIAWYRKHFSVDPQLEGKRVFLHFEAIMGKSKVWVNGKLLKEHFGGFLPAVVDVTDALNWNGENMVAVLADNSNDPMYPPGKPQETLDFSYFGGIYRDCFLVAHNNVHITDPNYENEIAGGGLFVAYNNVSEERADLSLKLHLRNQTTKSFKGKVNYLLQDRDGNKVKNLSQRIAIVAGKDIAQSTILKLKNPQLWSPENPYLYWLTVIIKDASGKVVDGYKKRIGVRSLEFKGKDGFWLNGKPYPSPLIGANRHQDFAVIGNALSNNIHWRDAKKLRDVGMKVIRNAHYPQDPSFMDACDELGLFVIVNTPGWQFWNNAPIFQERVFSDIRNMVRRDRNHPSVWMWEPILNETHYPADFAKNVKNIVHEEYPYPYCYTACDAGAKGKEHFPILFTHPQTGVPGWGVKKMEDTITYFTREWGDNVDNWNSHNSPSRVYRDWGEEPMLVQANHYANPTYKFTCYETLFHTARHHMGGTLWHAFDHQRGYHPDPFYGGLMDAFRQPKYSYHMFMAQRSPQHSNLLAETGPVIFIAHEMTPFSPKDVTVFSNCDEVRLTVFKGGKQYTNKKDKERKGMPSPVIVFEDVYDVMQDKAMTRAGKEGDVYMLAEGIINGKVVTTHKRIPARRLTKIMLQIDNNGVDLVADGSDFVTVIATMTDRNGNIKRLNNDQIRFKVSGEGGILGENSGFVNPRPIEWGTAPLLVQSSLKAGKITVYAEVILKGSQKAVSGEITFESVTPKQPLIYDLEEAKVLGTASENSHVNLRNSALEKKIEQLQQELNSMKLKEVEKQQSDFEN